MIGEELKHVTLFKGLSDGDLAHIADAMQPRTLARGEILFRHGEPGNAMFLVRSGRIRIFIRDEQGGEITFRYFGAGQIVGEFAILDDRERSASADAADVTEVMIFSREAFMQFLEDRPMIGITMMRSLAERVRYTTQYLERMLNAVELLTSNQYDSALQAMAGEADEDSIQGMIGAFVEMTRSMRSREASVPRVIARAKYEVDPAESDEPTD